VTKGWYSGYDGNSNCAAAGASGMWAANLEHLTLQASSSENLDEAPAGHIRRRLRVLLLLAGWMPITVPSTETLPTAVSSSSSLKRRRRCGLF
jgi:hypothetical protein